MTVNQNASIKKTFMVLETLKVFYHVNPLNQVNQGSDNEENLLFHTCNITQV